jgi:hypothetical protein
MKVVETRTGGASAQAVAGVLSHVEHAHAGRLVGSCGSVRGTSMDGREAMLQLWLPVVEIGCVLFPRASLALEIGTSRSNGDTTMDCSMRREFTGRAALKWCVDAEEYGNGQCTMLVHWNSAIKLYAF